MTWQINTLNKSGGKGVYLYKGNYAKIRIQLNKSTPGYFQPGKVKLGLSEKDAKIFELAKTDIELDPLQAFETYTYIGIKCDKPISETSFTIEWTILSKNIEVTIKSFKIDVFSAKSSLYTNQEMFTLPMNTYGYIGFSEEYNIDDISLTVSSLSTKIETITLPKFTNQRIKDYIYLPFKTGTVTSSTSVSFIVELETEAKKCYNIKDNTFRVTVTTDKPAYFSTSSQAQLIDSLELKSSFKSNSITITAVVPSYPLLLSCELSPTNKEFKDEVIRNQNEKGNANNYYLQSLINKKENNIEFESLNFFNEYSMKCIFDNTAVETSQKQSISFTAGRLEGSDKKEALFPRYRNTNPAQCTTWTFTSNLDDNDAFINSAAGFCYNIFRTKESVSPSEDGCISCSIVKHNDFLNKASICIGSHHTCTTQLYDNATQIFQEQFIDKLSTKELILTNIKVDLGSNDIKVINTEIDNSAPNISLITGKVKTKQENSVTFEVMSNNDQTIECKYNKLNDKPLKLIFGNELIDYSVILEKGISKSIEVTYESQTITDPSVNLVFNCRNLPGYDRSYYQTSPFAVITFINSNEEVKEDKETQMDCNDISNSFNSICIYKTKLMKPMRFSVPGRENNEEEIDRFNRLTHNDQKIKLQIEMTKLNKKAYQYQEQDLIKRRELSDINDPTEIINQVIKISELLSQYNCYAYTECREQRKAIHSKLMNFLHLKFSTCDLLFNQLDNFGFSSFEANTKILFNLLEILSNSPDAINNSKDSNFFSDMSICLVDNFDKLWAKLKSIIDNDDYVLELHKRDLLNMLTRLTTNLIDIHKYDQIDKNFDLKIIEKYGHFSNEKPKQIKEIIDKSFGLFSQLANTTFLYNDNNTIIANVITKSSYYNYEYRIDLNNSYIDIEMDFKGILEEDGADKIIVLFYPYYPLFPMNSTVFDSRVVSIKLVNPKGVELPYTNNYIITKPKIVYITKDKTATPSKYNDCFYYDAKSNDFSRSKSDYKVIESNDVCFIKFFSDFAFQYIGGSGLEWWGILLIVLGVVALITIIIVVVFVIKTRKKQEIKQLAQPKEITLNEKQGITHCKD